MYTSQPVLAGSCPRPHAPLRATRRRETSVATPTPQLPAGAPSIPAKNNHTGVLSSYSLLLPGGTLRQPILKRLAIGLPRLGLGSRSPSGDALHLARGRLFRLLRQAAQATKRHQRRRHARRAQVVASRARRGSRRVPCPAAPRRRRTQSSPLPYCHASRRQTRRNLAFAPPTPSAAASPLVPSSSSATECRAV